MSYTMMPMWQQGENPHWATANHAQVRVQRHNLLKRLGEWHDGCIGLSKGDHESETFAILESYVILAGHWIKCISTRDEAAFNRDASAFSSILARASRHVSHGIIGDGKDQVAQNALVNFELGWMSVLYWTTLKCRKPELRSQALSLLQRIPRQEGIWHCDRLTALAERVVEREAAGELFQQVIAGPQYVEEGVVKFKGNFWLAETNHDVPVRVFSEILTIAR